VIDIPTEALGDAFDRLFSPGSVWFYKQFCFPTTGERRDKYLIVLNPRAADDRAYFILPTSRIAKIKANRIYAADSFQISKEFTDFFPVDTVVVVSNIQALPYADIRNAYVDHPFPRKIEYKGTLDSRIFYHICDMARNSDRISPRQLQLIFP
jgi:hypothetical protein